MQWGMQWRIKRWCDCMMTSTVQFNSWMPNSESNADPKHFSLDIRLTNEEQIFNSSGKQDELKWQSNLQKSIFYSRWNSLYGFRSKTIV